MKFYIKNLLILALFCGITSTLTACGSGEPSIADITEAINESKIARGDPLKRADEIVMTTCKEERRNIFRCGVGYKREPNTIDYVLFGKSDGHWHMMSENALRQ